MADDVAKIARLLSHGARLKSTEWLDDQGRAAEAVAGRSMLRVTLLSPGGRPMGFRVPVENVLDLIHEAGLQPAEILG